MTQRLNLRNVPRHINDYIKRENMNQNRKSLNIIANRSETISKDRTEKKKNSRSKRTKTRVDKAKHIAGKNQEQRLIPTRSFIKP